jgi:hypothetical protein
LLDMIKDGTLSKAVTDATDLLNEHSEMFGRLTGVFARHGIAEPGEGFKKEWRGIEKAVWDMGAALDAANAKLKAGVAYGPEAFRFVTFMSWVNKLNLIVASSWFERYGLTGKTAVCLDAKGRICRLGRDFMQARDEDAFPVTVHPYRPTEPTEKAAERPTRDPIKNSTPRAAGPS